MLKVERTAPFKRRKLDSDVDLETDDEISSEAESSSGAPLPLPSTQRNPTTREDARLSGLDDEYSSGSGEELALMPPAASSSRLTLKPGAVSRPSPPIATSLPSTAPQIPYSERPDIRDFSSLGILPSLIKSLSSMSIRHPTPVQAGCIPSILAGKDCIGNAKTGQGKTIAFALPILQQLARDPFGIFALILTPTRELAFQISEQINAIGAVHDVRTTVVVGGMDMSAQMVAMQSRPHIVVATPGRLVDIITESSGEWDLGRIKFLVIDEADRLLGAAFASELATIFAELPERRQTLLFTATLTPTIETLALAPPRAGKEKPFVYRDSDDADIKTVESLKQQFILCPSHVREVYLYHLLCNPPSSILHLRKHTNHDGRKRKTPSKLKGYQIGVISKDGKKQKIRKDDLAPPQPPPTIIFVQTSQTAAQLEIVLKELGFRSVSLHSKLNQKQRLNNLNLFRGFVVPVLISTDVGARGLDMDGVGMVINYDLPRNPRSMVRVTGEDGKVHQIAADPGEGTQGADFQTAAETYVHRVGRTARMGRGGVAVSFVTERRWDEDTIKHIESKINVKLTELAMDEDIVLEKLNLVSAAKRLAQMELDASGFGDRQERHKRIKAKQKRIRKEGD